MDEERRIGISLEFAKVLLDVHYQAKEEQETYTSVRELYLDGEQMQGNMIPRNQLMEHCNVGKERKRLEILVII